MLTVFSSSLVCPQEDFSGEVEVPGEVTEREAWVSLDAIVLRAREI